MVVRFTDILDRQVSNVQTEEEGCMPPSKRVEKKPQRSGRDLPGSWAKHSVRSRSMPTRCCSMARSWSMRRLPRIKRGNWAAGSAARAVEKLANILTAMPDAYLRERATDITRAGRANRRSLARQGPISP